MLYTNPAAGYRLCVRGLSEEIESVRSLELEADELDESTGRLQS
jgi:hypothetical protein